MFPVYNVIFFIFSIVLISAATMVVVSRNPVHAVLFIMLAFFSSAVLWMMMQAEFLSLVLIFVYLGAVMALFLFVVMMLNIDLSKMEKKFVRLLPLGLLSILSLISTMVVVVRPRYFSVASTTLLRVPDHFSNSKAMGVLLYTHYLLPFEIAAVILLVAIIAAITLAFHERKSNTKSQCIREQLEITKENRLRVIKMKAEKS